MSEIEREIGRETAMEKIKNGPWPRYFGKMIARIDNQKPTPVPSLEF